MICLDCVCIARSKLLTICVLAFLFNLVDFEFSFLILWSLCIAKPYTLAKYSAVSWKYAGVSAVVNPVTPAISIY